MPTRDDRPRAERPACADPECSRPVSQRMTGGARWGIPGRIHATCYARRAARARRQAAAGRGAVAVGKGGVRCGRVPRDCPPPEALDRMKAAEAVRVILAAWRGGWASVALTAASRAWEDVRPIPKMRRPEPPGRETARTR
jgi:hypothetical protein